MRWKVAKLKLSSSSINPAAIFEAHDREKRMEMECRKTKLWGKGAAAFFKVGVFYTRVTDVHIKEVFWDQISSRNTKLK